MQFLNDIIKSRHGFKTTQKWCWLWAVVLSTLRKSKEVKDTLFLILMSCIQLKAFGGF